MEHLIAYVLLMLPVVALVVAVMDYEMHVICFEGPLVAVVISNEGVAMCHEPTF